LFRSRAALGRSPHPDRARRENARVVRQRTGETPCAHLGYVGLADAKEVGRLDLLQAPVFHDRFDLEDQLCLDKVLIGIRNADVFEHIPAAGFASLFGHGSLSVPI
jgi:hypothetical protein